jgi:hypothetical protein
MVEILGIRKKMIKSFYIRTIEKLETAEKQIQADHDLRWRAGTAYGGSIFPLEQVAAKAKISMFRANLAAKWGSRIKKYGG